MHYKLFILYCVLSGFLINAAAVRANQDENAALEELHRTLQQRIATLQSEQNLLLFQKEMNTSDSKYLLLNISEKTGQLKYKNRVLRNFTFMVKKNFTTVVVQPGMLSLTKKVMGNANRHALIFGTALIIQWKRVLIAKKEEPALRIFVAENDLLSIYSAVREGAKAYVVQ